MCVEKSMRIRAKFAPLAAPLITDTVVPPTYLIRKVSTSVRKGTKLKVIYIVHTCEEK